MTSWRYQTLALGAASMLVLSGCRSVPKSAGFPDVRNSVAARLGKDLHWNQGTADDQLVTEKVQAMLGNELSVNDSVQIALLNNRNLQATYDSLGIAQADVVQAGLLKNPSFGGHIRPPVSSGVMSQIGLELAQDFLDLLFIPLRKKAAAAEFEAAKARVTSSVIEVAGQTQIAFYDFQASQQALQMWTTTLQATEASLVVAEKMREAGNTSKLDFALEQAQHDQSKLGVAKAEAVMNDTRERLNRLMGLWGKSASSWRASAMLPTIPLEEISAVDIEKRAIEANLQLMASRHEVEALARRHGVKKIESVLPSLEAGVGAEREDDGTWFVGPTLALEIPIFDQGQARRFKARAEVRRALESHAALAVEIRSHARSAMNRIGEARSRAIFQRDQILPLRKEILDQTQLQFNAMQIGVFQLLQAKRDQIEAGRQYIETLREYWHARTSIEQTLAGVSPNELRGTSADERGRGRE